MKKIILILGILFTAFSLFYFVRLIYFLINHYQLSDYGYGILVGKFVILLIGIFLIYFDLKRRSVSK